jgi:hypothetical protein
MGGCQVSLERNDVWKHGMFSQQNAHDIFILL